jgi:lipopolysaccharide export system permease protein
MAIRRTTGERQLKLLDKYLIKQFIQTILFGLLAFTLIFVVIDAMENLDDFIDQSVPWEKIFHYYFVFSPEILKLMTPVAVLFGALFTAGKAANLSELTAIKAAGVSFYRFMAPFLITSLIISVFSIYFGGYLVPMANKTKQNIEMTYLKRGFNFSGNNIFFQDNRTRIVGISFFDNNLSTAYRVSIQEFNVTDYTKMIIRIDASKMVYDSVNASWNLRDGVKRVFYLDRESAEYFQLLNIKDLNFRPEDLVKKQQKPQDMNLTELQELIDTQERAGNDPTSTLIEYHSRYAFAVSSLIIVLFGLPISTTRRKSGMAAQVGINILVTFIYLVFMKISQAFGKNGALDPLITAWFANLIFLGAGIVNLPRVKH